jgi:hypothetical protein
MTSHSDDRNGSSLSEAPAAHTPGPWFVDTLAMSDYYYGVRANQSRTVARVARSMVVERDRAALYDAHLIAAAPSLLAALRNLLNGIDTGAITSEHDETFANAIAQARAAVEKANG